MSTRPRASFVDGIVLLIISAIISLQAWTLREVVNLKVSVASLDIKLTDHIESSARK